MGAVWIVILVLLALAIAFVIIQQKRRAGGVIAGTKPMEKPDGK
ncbi:hypothetical protein BH10ACT1_BH10ACT1_11940 [soil metagenome]